MTFPEFKRALGPERMNFGLDDDDLQHLFNHCDVDGSGDVSYAELTRALGTQHYLGRFHLGDDLALGRACV